jgi:hypothetical protein
LCWLAEYFEGIEGVPGLPARMNPATWIIDIVSDPSQSESGEPRKEAVASPAASQIAFHEYYKSSAVFVEAGRVIEQASKVSIAGFGMSLVDGCEWCVRHRSKLVKQCQIRRCSAPILRSSLLC